MYTADDIERTHTFHPANAGARFLPRVGYRAPVAYCPGPDRSQAHDEDLGVSTAARNNRQARFRANIEKPLLVLVGC